MCSQHVCSDTYRGDRTSYSVIGQAVYASVYTGYLIEVFVWLTYHILINISMQSMLILGRLGGMPPGKFENYIKSGRIFCFSKTALWKLE